MNEAQAWRFFLRLVYDEACYQLWLDFARRQFKFPSRQLFIKRMMYLAPVETSTGRQISDKSCLN